MFEWIKSMFTEDEVKEINDIAPGDGDAARAVIEGLNLVSAIETHLRWKKRLSEYIDGSSKEKLDPAAIAVDDQCVLGKWIYGAGGQKFGTDANFVELRDTHAHFHRCAANIVSKADAGERDEAATLLGSGDYPRLSMQIVRELSGLWSGK